MIHVKNGYPQQDINSSGIRKTTVFYSTNESDIDNKISDLQAHGINDIRKSSENGIYEVECIEKTGIDGETSEAPDTSYGVKTATLQASTLSMPLEQHKNYRTHWNHHLFYKDSTTPPAFWQTAKDLTIPEQYKKVCRWGEHTSEAPDDWHVIKMTKDANHYVIPTYCLSETARYRSFQAAAAAIGDRLGKVCAPYTKLTVKSDRDWMCEDAQIQWDGKYWIGRLTYTLSGPGGWDKDMYERC